MKSRFYPWMVLFTVLIGTFMGVIDSTIVNVALHSIKSAFGVSLDAAQWVSTAYMLALAVMLLVSPWLGERIGYKWSYLLGLIFFTLFSFLCAISWNMTVLLLFRALQGFGGGILGTVGMVLWRREFPPERQSLPMGIYMIAVGGGIAFGPPLGGYLIEKLTWPAIFFINVPVGFLGIVLALFLLRAEKRGSFAVPLDSVGLISLCLFLAALITALAEGNAKWNTDGWTSGFMICCYLIGGLSLLLFLITELRVAHPLIDLRIFLDSNFAIGSIVYLCLSIALSGGAIMGPYYVQTALNYTQYESGLTVLPVGLVMSVVGMISGVLARRMNMKWMCVAGLLIYAYGCYMAVQFSLYTEWSWILNANSMMGLGLGLLITPLSTLMLAWMPDHLLGSASGTYQALRNVGGAMGVALYETVLSLRQVYHNAIYGQSADQYPSNLAVAVDSVQNYVREVSSSTGEGLVEQSQAVLGVWFRLQAFVSSVDDVYSLGLVLLVSAIIPTLFLRSHKGLERLAHVAE
jgi:MFS transporter, DHA2 family, multidrug resistance protein